MVSTWWTQKQNKTCRTSTKETDKPYATPTRELKYFTMSSLVGQFFSIYKESIYMPTEYQAEREEIINAAMRLMDVKNLYYLLGTAQGLLELEMKQASRLQ